jgi:hypothetical protein
VMEQFIEQAFVLDDTPLDPRADADQIRVLMHWLYAHRDDLHRFECSDYQQTDDMADHVVAQMRLQILSAVDPTD